MKYAILIVLSLMTFALCAIEIISTSGKVYVFGREDYKDFELVERTTIRAKKEPIREDHWRGIKLSDFIKKYDLESAEMVEFLADDNYLIRLSGDEIVRFDPILALERNGETIDESLLRLVSANMPDLYWIANISQIKPFTDMLTSNPERIVPYHTAINAVRLYDDPYPFVDVKGYRLYDILSLYSVSTESYIGLTSKDGLQQTLHFNQYLRDAVLVIDENRFNIQSPNMPAGMWLKDIMFIETANEIIFFYNDIDFANCEIYKAFVQKVSTKERTATAAEENYKITNWEDLQWEDISIIH